MYLPEALSIHPRDYARLRAAGKTVSDMGTVQRVASQVRNLARHPSRDIGAILRADRLRSGRGKAGKDVADRRIAAGLGYDQARVRLQQHAGGQATMGIQALHNVRSQADAFKNTMDTIDASKKRWRSNQVRIGKRTALAVGGTVLALGAGKAGLKTYKNWRKKAKEKTKYRDIEVYPEHGHAAVGVQPHNQPYYNDPRFDVPVREEFRERLINNILETR